MKLPKWLEKDAQPCGMKSRAPFHPPLSLGSRSSGFIESEVQAMIAARAVGF